MIFHSRAKNGFIIKKNYSPFNKALVLAVVKHISKVYNTAAVHNSTNRGKQVKFLRKSIQNFQFWEKRQYVKEIAKSKTDNIESNLVKKNSLPMQISRQAYIC